jgi:hypothetical protein
VAKKRPEAITDDPPERSFAIEIGGSSIQLLGCVKGLVSESSIVQRAVEETAPTLIGLHIGPEEMKGLNAVIDGELKETELSSYEKLYALRLSRFGEVQVPPPSLVQALRSARTMGIPVEPLDMGDAEYSELYVEEIGGITMMRQSLRLKKVSRVKFKEEDPARFSMHWDQVVNHLAGFQRLEARREHLMAERIRHLSRKGGVHLHVLEMERLKGIYSFLAGAENPSDKVK